MPYPRVIPHSDGAGVIDVVGKGVAAAREGQRVWCYGAQSYRPFGTAAEYVILPEAMAVPLPDAVDVTQGACLGIPGITAHRAVYADGPVAGTTVLVTGAAGGVGRAAVALALRGGAMVIATVTRTSDVEPVRTLGAHHVVDVSMQELVSSTKAVTDGQGVDRVIEVDFGSNAATDSAVLSQGGVIVAYATNDPEPTIPFWPLLFNNVVIRLLGSDDFPAAAKAEAAAELSAAAASKQLWYQVAVRYPLDAIVQAHEAVEHPSAPGRVDLSDLSDLSDPRIIHSTSPTSCDRKRKGVSAAARGNAAKIGGSSKVMTCRNSSLRDSKLSGIAARGAGVQIVDRGDTYVLNNCSKYLARAFRDPRHNYGQFLAGDVRAFIADGWRFPIVDAWTDGVNFVPDYAFNSVTFVYPVFPGAATPRSVSVIGTFCDLFGPTALQPVAGEPLFALTVVLPKGRVYTYQFMVDGRPVLDPVNPQRVVLDNGKTWSRFFTDLCTIPLIFEDWELTLLDRMTQRILPFHTDLGQNFLKRYYDTLSNSDKESQFAKAYRLDEPVGVVNFIDKLVAKQENHRLTDYRLCLVQMDAVLRSRYPYVDPADMPDEVYDDLYSQMSTDNVPGWDTSAYGSPAFFLKMLRRHAYEGAFSHPKYGGNVGAAGWAYLEGRFTDPATGATLFNWERIMEPPLGNSVDYRG